jgi:hypothetical protein
VPDYAVLVVNRSTKTLGIAIVRSKAKHVDIVGAGGAKLHVAALPDGSPAYWLDAFNGCDTWYVASKESLKPTKWDQPVTQMAGEGIVIGKAEAFSGLIYWDGKQYRWLQTSN